MSACTTQARDTGPDAGVSEKLTPDESRSVVQRASWSSVSGVELSRPLRELAPSLASEHARTVEHLLGTNPNEPALLAPQIDPVVQSAIAPRPFAFPAALLNFQGQGETLSKATITGTPPDTNGAVGPNHYVQTVNGGLAIWDKSGNLVWGSKLLNVLWTGYTGTNAGNQCATRNDGDPVVVYDQLADRWFITQFSVPNKAGPDFQCVAVSQTPDPTGKYYLYDFQYSFFNDYGKFGIWPDAYYATFNDFTHKFGGADMCAYDRLSMLAGKPATQVCFVQPTSVFGVLPVSLDGKVPPPRGEPGFFMNFGANSLNLWKFHVDFATPSNSALTGPTSIAVMPFTTVPNNGGITEPGGKLDSLGDRLMFRLAYRNFGTHESLTVNHSVQANGTSGPRWYEIWSPNGTPTVHQQGTYAPNDGLWRWMGSLAQDQAQDFALGFSTSSSTQDPSIAWTARLQSDPLGTMGMTQGEATIDVGTATEVGATRWGDYSNMTVDPTDDCTFWYTQEDYHTTGTATWDTRIAAFKLPSCAQNDFSISISPATQTVAQGASVTYTITAASTVGTAETITLNVQDLPSGVTGAFVPATVTAGGTSVLTLTASSTAPPASSVVFTVIGTATSAVHFATASVTVSGTCVPITTCPAGTNCGTIPNGCGSTVSCGGACTSPQSCGGGGTPNVCGCTPITTCSPGVCGTVDNGCGSTLSCPACTAPQTCGGGGTPNLCGCTSPPIATTCAGKCGTVNDTCNIPQNCSTTFCTPPANSSATCSGSTCGFSCNTGFHNCAGSCAANTSVNSCGSSCTACPTDANGTATCNGTSCGITCNPGFHLCGGACADNTSVNSCGTSCTACPTPANPCLAAACNAGVCGTVPVATCPVDMAQGPVDMAQGPVDMAQGPVDMAQGPVDMAQGPVDMAQGGGDLSSGGGADLASGGGGDLSSGGGADLASSGGPDLSSGGGAGTGGCGCQVGGAGGDVGAPALLALGLLAWLVSRRRRRLIGP